MSKITKAIRAVAIDHLRRIAPGAVQQRFCFPADFPGFAGHFPGYPILPAVVQLQAGLCVAEDALGQPLRLVGVENAKFLQQLRPQQEIRIESREQHRDDRLFCATRLWRDEDLAASFILVLTPAEASRC
ncbi:MAG: hypothetical protein WDA20_00485 [Desulfuromonadales bacterium]